MARMCGLDVKQLIMHMICTKYMQVTHVRGWVQTKLDRPTFHQYRPAALPRTGLPPSTGPPPPRLR
jgi:hypothetical protein